MNTEKVGGSSYHIYTELILKLSSIYAYISQAVSFLQVFFSTNILCLLSLGVS
jgi:hypothetical protein